MPEQLTPEPAHPPVIPEPVCEPLGDSALLFSWPQLEEPGVEVVVQAAHRSLLSGRDPAVRGLVPGWSTLAVHFSPLEESPSVLENRLRLQLRRAPETVLTAPRCLRIPVSFAPEHALDLPEVAMSCGLTVSGCIAALTASVFRVRLIGFAPGFPYLSGLPEAFHLPRRATPRLTVPAGSVAIAGGLAGIYPQASPGGWHIVGRTSLALFDPQRTPPCLLQPGDEVQLERLDLVGGVA
ncbi:MAG: hypothetical protein RLZZ436_4677 [Planctomycetota bacterium]|jgi:KipI family sensor histidine kinase inhibitor